MNTNGKLVITYIKTGYLLHIVTVAELVGLYVLLQILHVGAWMMEDNTIARFFILLPLLWSPLFPQLDARSRFQNYKMMKDHFYQYGFDTRLLKRVVKSRCQRDAILIAAIETGYGEQCKSYFKSCGYKWYNLFPDIIFEQPLVLLTRTFWVTTFFAKTYHPKIDYSVVKLNHSKQVAIQINAA